MVKEKSIFERLKKQNGESFAKAIRNFDNGIFELPNLLEIVKYAGREAEPIIPYLRMLKQVLPDEHGVYQDPITLLKQAGYDAFVADTLKKKNSIKSYYAPGEEICTFKDAYRHENYHIIHAIKEGADSLNRDDFWGRERRQDAYGTSVISIQILKSGGFISIKNRYNHTVEACDNTFDSNPDNIISGLSEALKRYFKVDFGAQRVSLPNGYVYQNGIYQYYQERENIYFGNGFYLKDGKVTEIDKNSELLVDTMVINLKTKEVVSPVSISQPTVKALKKEIEGKILQVKNIKGTKILLADGKEVLRTRDNKLVSLTLQADYIPEDAFKDVEFLEELNAPNLKQLSGASFKCSGCLKRVDIRSCEQISGETFAQSPHDIEINMQALSKKNCHQLGRSIVVIKEQGAKFLNFRSMPDSLYNILEKEFEGKEISIVRNNSEISVFVSNQKIMNIKEGKIVELCLFEPKIITRYMSVAMPDYIEKLELKNALEIKSDALSYCRIGCLKAPKLKKIGSFSLSSVVEIDAPSVEVIEDRALRGLDTRREVYLPNLKYMGKECLSNATIYAPKLETVAGISILKYTREVSLIEWDMLGFSGHLKIDKNIELVKQFLQQSDIQKSPLYKFVLTELEKAEKIEIKNEILSSCVNTSIIADGEEVIKLSRLVSSSGRIQHLSLPHAEKLPAGLIKGFKELEKVSLQNLIEMEDENLKSCPAIREVYTPKLIKTGDSCFNHLDFVACLIMPNLQRVGAHCFRNLKLLRRLDVPRLKTAGHRFLHSTSALERFFAPKLKERLSFFRWHPNYRLILRNMDEPNTPRHKEKVPFFRALFYKDRHQKNK